MKTIAVVSQGESDLTEAIGQSGIDYRIIAPNDIGFADLDCYDGVALLGGTTEKPLLLNAPSRISVDRQIAAA